MDEEYVRARARAREQRAREREQRAAAARNEAERRAHEEPDPAKAAIYLGEAEMFGRAERLHHQARELQARHQRGAL